MRTSVYGSIMATLCLGFAGQAAAQGNASGWYFGLGLGNSSFSGDLPGQTRAAYQGNGDFQLVTAKLSDDSDSAKQLFVGYRFTPWLGVELGWQDLGEAHTFYSVRSIGGGVLSPGPSNLTGNYQVRDLNAAVVVTYPITEQFEVLARGGVAETRLKYAESGIGVNGQPYSFQASSDNHAGALVGLGVAWNFAPAWGVRLGVDRIYQVGDRFALTTSGNGRFDHIDAWTVNLIWKP